LSQIGTASGAMIGGLVGIFIFYINRMSIRISIQNGIDECLFRNVPVC